MRAPTHFETDRLSLRPVELADAQQIYDGYARHPAPTRFMIFARHSHLRESEDFARRCEECWRDGSASCWALVTKEGGTFVGAIELRLRPPKADFGYILCESAWGNGYATEAACAIVRWALAQPAIFRVWPTCHPDNKASAHVLEKAGLELEARLKNWEPRPQLGELAGDSLVYATIKAS